MSINTNIHLWGRVLGISRGSVYYHQRQVHDADLALMRRIDELHREHHSWARGCCVVSSGR